MKGTALRQSFAKGSKRHKAAMHLIPNLFTTGNLFCGVFSILSVFNANYMAAAVAILVLLFVVQPLGTSRIGAAFGPIMLLWFVSIAALGLWGVGQDPSVLRALNPYYAVHLLGTSGLNGFLVLGAIFLCVTGAEALYADMDISASNRSASVGLGSCFPLSS